MALSSRLKALMKGALGAALALVIMLFCLLGVFFFYAAREHIDRLTDVDYQQATARWHGTLTLPADATHISARLTVGGLQYFELHYRFTVDPARTPGVIEELKAMDDQKDKRPVVYTQHLLGAGGKRPAQADAELWWKPEMVQQGIAVEPEDGAGYGLHIVADTLTGTVYVSQTD